MAGGLGFDERGIRDVEKAANVSSFFAISVFGCINAVTGTQRMYLLLLPVIQSPMLVTYKHYAEETDHYLQLAKEPSPCAGKEKLMEQLSSQPS